MENKSVYHRLFVSAAILLTVFAQVSVGIAQSVAVSVRPEPAKLATVTVDVVDAPLARVLDAIVQQAGLRRSWDVRLIRSVSHVTLHVKNVPADVALAKALSGTGMLAVIDSKRVDIVLDTATAPIIQGSIAGKVIDAKTKQPVRGATILVDHASKGAISGDDGGFYIPTIISGEHTLHIRMLGYAKATKTVEVIEGQRVSVEVTLEPSVSALDQIVVTGTIVATAQKAVPNAMTVITAKDIEQRGITRIDQLFRGDVPGVFATNQGPGALLDEVTVFSRGVTALSPSSAGTSFGTNPIKTYVDGVELADPQYLSQLDPKRIERIEILTGPQASTIYGSNAINGVMQIFTKRGTTSFPELTLTLLSGWVENNFSSARTPQHDYNGQLSGIEGRISYNAGGSWTYIGPWTPSKQTARTGAFGGTRLEIPTAAGRVTADVTLRRSITQNRMRGSQFQTETAYRETGWYTGDVVGGNGTSIPTTYVLRGQTLGLTLGYAPTSWWSHEFGIGQDASDIETRYTARGYRYNAEWGADTSLLLQEQHTGRGSLHYTTTVQVPLTSLSRATVTFGADSWQNLETFTSVSPQTLTGTLTGSPSMSRQPGHNTGAFTQAQLGIKDQLFFTYGLRAEWNPDFGEEAEPSYAPRYGVAYTRDLGPVTAKLRASYGRSTRPPSPGAKLSNTFVQIGWGDMLLGDYGDADYTLANPELGPEHQQGGEGGVELYFGTRGSLVVTRYNQTVDGLISAPMVDSVRSFAPYPTSYFDSMDDNGYGYLYQYQYLNVGSIRNQGWELQGSVNTGPITTRGTYSWTKSRTIGITPKYRAFFTASSWPEYQPGATFKYLPEHTWALAMTYAHPRTTVALNVTGTGKIANGQDAFKLRSLSSDIRLMQNQLNVSAPYGAYVNFDNPYALADLNASHRFSSKVEGVLQVQNLMNHYTNDYVADFATMGRQIKMGVRVR